VTPLLRIAAAVALVALAVPAGAADLVIHQRSTTGEHAAPREETVYLTGDTVVTDSAQSRMIVDAKAKTITMADKDERTYSVLTFDDVRDQMEQVKKSMESMPPEVRKMFEDLTQGGAKVSVTPTGKTATIAGYAAKEYAIAGGPYGGTVWITDAIETPPQLAQWRELVDRGTGVGGGPSHELAEALATLKGFPLRTHIVTTAAGRTFAVSTEVLDVKEGTPPADVARVPTGYTKRQPPRRAD
jgi:uncharacterized protein DUF4412